MMGKRGTSLHDGHHTLVIVHGTVYAPIMGEQADRWDADAVRDLRRRLGLSQRALAEELGVRQQTVSEWETGVYRPRGASARMLRHVAERADRAYVASPLEEGRNADDRPISLDAHAGPLASP